MRRMLWLAVLVLGFGVMVAGDLMANRIESRIKTAAEQIVAGHGLRVAVSGRDITLSGQADTPANLAQIRAALDQIDGRRVVRVAVTLLPLARPYLLTITKDRGLTIAGNMPNAAARDGLTPDFGDQVAGLTLASGAPDSWPELVAAGMRALAPLTKGQVRLEGAVLIVTGQADGPEQAAQVQAALTDLPGFAVNGIVMLDDGTPAKYGLNYQHIGGTSLRGKLPKGLSVAAMQKALGVPKIKGDVTFAATGPLGEADYLTAWAGIMDQLDSLTSTVNGADRRVLARLLPGADAARVQAALETGGFVVQISAPPPRVLDQPSTAKRVLTVGDCQATTDRILADTKVVFLPNSDQIDSGAVIATLAKAMQPCIAAHLRAEIGGHTDTSGKADANLILSQARADTVRAALIAQGMPGAALTAKGYGASQPISENDTAEGRVKNRRTTVTWAQ